MDAGENNRSTVVSGLLVVSTNVSTARSRTVRIEPGGVLSVGRSRQNDIVLTDPGVSGRHATVRLVEGRLEVTDIGSRNRTWLRDAAGNENRIPPETPTPVGEGEVVRIESVLLVPCEMLGDDVALTSDASFGASGGTHDRETHVGSLPPEIPDRAGPAALIDTLSDVDPGDAAAVGTALLDGLMKLAGTGSGFLLAVSGDRPMLRASRGHGNLSRHVLESTIERGSSWVLGRVGEKDSAAPSDSLQSWESADFLVGVPFRLGDGTTIGVASLQDAGELGVELDELDAYARLAAPVLHLAWALDDSRRATLAAEDRLQDGGGPRLGTADEPTVALIGKDPAFLEAVSTVTRAASSDATLLLRGPSGSGKEQLAQLAHQSSRRRSGPFVALNCAALPDTLVESELFGVDRGAFTGADKPRSGAFGRANGGTLFLDEIADLSLSAQSKILRAIETGEVVRVGGSVERVDIRLLAATHRNLETMVADEEFREDLYFRLRIIEVELPPLARRTDDVLPLVEFFLDRFHRPDGRRVSGVTLRAGRSLGLYSWPGNVRELRNVIERAVVLDRDGVLDIDDLPREILGSAPGAAPEADVLLLPWADARERFEERYFRAAFERHAGKVQETADATGVDRRTLSTKIRRYGLRDTDDDEGD